MNCPHRIVRQVRIIPDDANERRLAMSVALAISQATRAPVGICTPSGVTRGWVSRAWCVECEPY